MTKKLLSAALLIAPALLFCFSANAQNTPPAGTQNTPGAPAAAVIEDVAYELPAMVSEKTVPIFDAEFANIPGVRITDYCYNLHLIIFSVDRSVQPDNTAIEQKLHHIFHTDDSMMHLQSKPAFKKAGYIIMCNELDHIQR